MLFADDNDDFRTLLAEGLEILGFQIDAFPNGELLKPAILATDPPYVILTDLLMPRTSGYEIIDWLRENELDGLVPAVVLSAVASPDIGAGMLVIEKPVDIERLARALDVQVKLAGRHVDEARKQLAKLRGLKRTHG